jgi:hypothetical protein
MSSANLKWLNVFLTGECPFPQFPAPRLAAGVRKPSVSDRK